MLRLLREFAKAKNNCQGTPHCGAVWKGSLPAKYNLELSPTIRVHAPHCNSPRLPTHSSHGNSPPSITSTSTTTDLLCSSAYPPAEAEPLQRELGPHPSEDLQRPLIPRSTVRRCTAEIRGMPGPRPEQCTGRESRWRSASDVEDAERQVQEGDIRPSCPYQV